LQDFEEELKAAGNPLPAPKPDNDCLFDSLAEAFSNIDVLPERMRNTVLLIETAATPENEQLLDSVIQGRIPGVSLNRSCPLDCALELWFACPDELPQFKSADASFATDSSPLTSDSHPLPPDTCHASPLSNNPSLQSSNLGVSSIEHPASSIQHQETSIAPEVLLTKEDPTLSRSDAPALLDSLVHVLTRFVVLPKHAPEALALWILHTYAFQLRDVSVYIGIESPEKRCGKTTLLTVLNELARNAIAASNISPPAFFRVIEDLSPTLLIDEADTFLNANDTLRGILNAGYKKKTAFVYRAANESSLSRQSEAAADSPASRIIESPTIQQSNNPTTQSSTGIRHYSCWCPKAIATIDRLPETLADRCIIIRMHRKATNEECERMRKLDAEPLRRQCAAFIQDHSSEIAAATPELPFQLSDRAADIWEPLLVLADLAGGDWPQRARQAALHLAAAAQQSSPIGSLLLDIYIAFFLAKTDRLLTRDLLDSLNASGERPWRELRHGKGITDRSLSQLLRPYGITSRSIRVGDSVARGYLRHDLNEAFRRYIPRSEFDALRAEVSSNKQATEPAL
jgi:hypothetical protein